MKCEFNTVTDLLPLINLVVEKMVNLKQADFGRFTSERLPSDYFVARWKNNRKNFADVWGNMDPTHQELFLRFCGYTDDDTIYLAIAHVSRFMQWAYNWDGDSYAYNAFNQKTSNGQYASKLATGKINPQCITDWQVIKAYHKAPNDEWRLYFLKAALAAKKKEVANG